MSSFIELVPYPDAEEFLYVKSIPVAVIDDEIISIAHKMAQIMYDYDGIGISAPQVGINKRIIVLDCTENKNNGKYLDWKNQFLVTLDRFLRSYGQTDLKISFGVKFCSRSIYPESRSSRSRSTSK